MSRMFEPGAKAVSGQIIAGRIVLTSDDGTTYETQVYYSHGTIVDNGDGTCTLTIT